MTNIDILKSLTQTTYDSVEGYRKAAEKADSPALKEALLRRAGQRSTTLEKLNNALEVNGEQPISGASVSGVSHQSLLNIDSILGGGDKAAAKRVEEGEDYLAKQFDDALKNDTVDTSTRLLIEDAFAEIRQGERFGDILEEQYA